MIVPEGLVDLLPVPEHETSGFVGAITIHCEEGRLVEAAHSLAAALTVLPFEEYENLSAEPVPTGIKSACFAGAKGQHLRVIRQFHISSNTDKYLLTVRVK